MELAEEKDDEFSTPTTNINKGEAVRDEEKENEIQE